MKNTTKNVLKKGFIKTLAVFVFAFSFTGISFAESPNTVMGNIASSVHSDGIHLTWQDATGIDGSAVDHYRVYIDTHAIGSGEEYGDIQDTLTSDASFVITKFKDLALEDNIEYFFSVTAVNTEFEESLNYSKEASVIYTLVSNEEAVITENILEEPISQESPQVVSAQAVDTNTILVSFSEEVILPESINDAFSIMSESMMLEVMSAEVLDKSVELTTLDQTDGVSYTLTALSSITSKSGVPVLSGMTDSASFIGSGKVKEEFHAAAEDLTAPEDITNFQVRHKLNAEGKDYTVSLDWDASVDSDGDLDHQNYYQKDSTSAYSSSISIEKDRTSYQKVLDGGERYTFKISTVDATGNESVGAIQSIILPETGPATILALTALIAAFAAYALRRRV